MKVAFVVQRYGLEICGGAELHCRQVVEHMSKQWEIEVFTTCAKDYATWENHYPAGTSLVDAIPVHRFPVTEHRTGPRFERLSRKVFTALHTREDELAWMRLHGPWVPDLPEALSQRRTSFDCFVFFTYLYTTTFYGLPRVREKAFLVPTAHDEPPLRLGMYRDLFLAPRAFIFNSPEERDLIHRRFRNQQIPGDVVGVGVDVPEYVDAERFREKYDLHGPFVLYIGRIDPAKKCDQLFQQFRHYQEALRGECRHELALIGQSFMDVPEAEGVRHLGFVPDEDKFDALAAADLLVLPSQFESLSMVVLEAWAVGTPVLVNGLCDVLVGQCRRAQGGLWYRSEEEFIEALDLLLSSPHYRERMGANGRRYVQVNYDWRVIEEKYRRIVAGTFPQLGAAV